MEICASGCVCGEELWSPLHAGIMAIATDCATGRYGIARFEMVIQTTRDMLAIEQDQLAIWFDVADGFIAGLAFASGVDDQFSRVYIADVGFTAREAFIPMCPEAHCAPTQ